MLKKILFFFVVFNTTRRTTCKYWNLPLLLFFRFLININKLKLFVFGAACLPKSQTSSGKQLRTELFNKRRKETENVFNRCKLKIKVFYIFCLKLSGLSDEDVDESSSGNVLLLVFKLFKKKKKSLFGQLWRIGPLPHSARCSCCGFRSNLACFSFYRVDFLSLCPISFEFRFVTCPFPRLVTDVRRGPFC